MLSVDCRVFISIPALVDCTQWSQQSSVIQQNRPVMMTAKISFRYLLSTRFRIVLVVSDRIYLLRLLRSQGMSSNHLNTIFHVIIVSRILYALPA